MTGRRVIKRRARIFLGCEGESEQGYGAFPNRLAKSHGAKKVHVLPINLRRAGDPLAIAEKAVKTFAKEEAGGKFAGKAILLDADRLSDPHDRGRRAKDLLTRAGFITIWQRPDHEGFLLRHFARHENDDPPRGRSMARLRKIWPDYRKNMGALDLGEVISLEHVQRAAGTNRELRKFLDMIGLARSRSR